MNEMIDIPNIITGKDYYIYLGFDKHCMNKIGPFSKVVYDPEERSIVIGDITKLTTETPIFAEEVQIIDYEVDNKNKIIITIEAEDYLNYDCGDRMHIELERK